MMIKIIRKPLITTIALLSIMGAIYFMTSSHSNIEVSLGPNTPMSLIKSGINKFNNFGESPTPPPKEALLNKQEIIDDVESTVADKDKSISDLNKDYGSDSVDDDPKDVYADEDANTEESTKSKGSKAAKKVKSKEINEKILDSGDEIGGDLISENLGITETPFMPQMNNATLKAQLGNAAWKLFHTILARYPDKPSVQERNTLSQYIQLFGQIYPCGDCARHFQKLLKKYPPQTSSRKTAALWGCDIHNKVNERLSKPEYDCTTILEDYDCGCGEDEKEADRTLGGETMDHLRKIKVEEIEEDGQLGG
ncbi:ERV/ALR sulfhydryl oxidase domain-containing protein [Scheffersomyces amazonensis]|uniref:ERV/ALR sulfhydryl oxidase domain-containing protein n=1 Tax=Scheffersomyces amazonensis TaxID=1078765 RepID=UPI00315DC89E